MFIAVLFTITKIWKQPKCPSVEEWIKHLWGIDTMEHDSAMKRRKCYPLRQCGWTWKAIFKLTNVIVTTLPHLDCACRQAYQHSPRDRPVLESVELHHMHI